MSSFPNPADAREQLAQPSHTPTWLHDVHSLVDGGYVDEACDIVFDRVDRMLSDGAYEKCDSVLRAMDAKRLDTNLLVAVLAATLPAREELDWRGKFLEKAERLLRERAPGRVDGLLQGLR